ncbi:MAG: acetoacetate--CoA ligase [Luteitalea sp.]|nr:acetoacetate--CoA ligase [Luteitalea sp.]
MTAPLWTPSRERIEQAEMTRFRRFVEQRDGRSFPTYAALHAWSIEDVGRFWRTYVAYTGIGFETPPHRITSADPMPHTRWFEGATLNYAHALLEPLSKPSASSAAIIAFDETGHERRLTWTELRHDVARAAAALCREGIGHGDRVTAYISNVPEAVILLLACASIGAIFSSCSPDFGTDAAFSRFHQIEPTLLVASDGYVYNGKRYETLPVVRELAQRIQAARGVVLVPRPGTQPRTDWTSWDDWLEPLRRRKLDSLSQVSGRQVSVGERGPGHAPLERDAGGPVFEPLPFDQPLYVLYSSGTTALPKAMVHRAGGALLTHDKELRLHSDVKPGDVLLYFTTCGWMMWNWLVSGLAQGATIVLFDGSPSYPSLEVLWRLADRIGITHFGTSARFIHACKAARLRPADFAGLDSLRAVLSTGSPLSASGFEWVYDAVKRDIHLSSISGGTDIVGCFMLGVPTEPVYAGQIQAAGLGIDLACYDDDGRPVVGRPGELVCRQPSPSMPLMFWNDPNFVRYRAAYFEHFPGVWRHGDLIEITREKGIIVYGRSDATLNPGGVRIGTAEIYRPLEALPDVVEALAAGKKDGEDEVVWLFVVLQPSVTLDAQLADRIRSEIRTKASPRHVPKQIFQVSQLPRTRSGKTMEMAVARLVNGSDVPNREAMANPEALDEIARVVSS